MREEYASIFQRIISKGENMTLTQTVSNWKATTGSSNGKLAKLTGVSIGTITRITKGLPVRSQVAKKVLKVTDTTTPTVTTVTTTTKPWTTGEDPKLIALVNIAIKSPELEGENPKTVIKVLRALFG